LIDLFLSFLFLLLFGGNMSESSPIATNSNNSPSDPDDISYQQDIDSKFADIDSKFADIDSKLAHMDSKFDRKFDQLQVQLAYLVGEFRRTSAAGQGSGGAKDKTPAVEQTPVRDSASFDDFDSQISTEQVKPSGQTLLQDMELESLRRGLTSLRQPPTVPIVGAAAPPVVPPIAPPVVPPIALSVVPPAVLPVSHPVPGTTMHAQSTGQGSIVSVAMTPDVDQTPDRTSASLDGAAVHSPVATRHAAFMVSPRAGMGGNVIDDVVLVEFVESSLSARQFTSSTSSAFSHGGVGKPELFRCDYDVARVPRPGTASSTSPTSGGFVCVGVHECWTAESYR
jgi:hypothetical protein